MQIYRTHSLSHQIYINKNGLKLYTRSIVDSPIFKKTGTTHHVQWEAPKSLLLDMRGPYLLIQLTVNWYYVCIPT